MALAPALDGGFVTRCSVADHRHVVGEIGVAARYSSPQLFGE